MRKRKENSIRPRADIPANVRDAVETANEERAAAIGGENATEGLGNGFDDLGNEADESNQALGSADGPAAGESTDPPFTPRAARKKHAKKRGVTPPDGPSNHAAAHSSKTI